MTYFFHFDEIQAWKYVNFLASIWHNSSVIEKIFIIFLLFNIPNRLYSEDELPEDFKLFLPIHRKKCIRERDVKEIEKKEPPEEIEIEEPPPFEGVPEEEREEEEEPEELPEELVEEIPPEIEPREIREEDEEEEAIEPEFEAEEEVEEEIEAEIGPTAYVTEEETEAEEPGDEEEYAVP